MARKARRGRRRGIPTSAIILIIIGALLLLQTTGLLSWDLWFYLWRFWPLLIIAIGLNMLLGRRLPWLAAALVAVLLIGAVGGSFALVTTDASVTTREGELVATSLTEPLGDLASVDVDITFGAGSLKVMSLPEDSPNLVEGQLETPGQAAIATLDRSGSIGHLRITMGSRGWWRGLSSHGFPSAEWNISLSRSPTLSIDLDGGAADMGLDLQELRVTNLNLGIGAASAEVAMPAHAGDVNVEIDAGAADVKVIIPEGVAARISKSSGLSSFDIDASRFPKSGDTWTSPDFGTVENRVTIYFRVGAASVSVR